ncbi:SUMF1/EgtB/PvdO family nonheme iron enzyme [Desulfococcaceae bacterium HSG8]|nr:SUMF1/EgtB/PvdO family nonheme iron enzyme [Desulfococcaceae bacterium HSG8]
MIPDSKLHQKIVSALIALPSAAHKEGRDALLAGIPPQIVSSLNRSDNARTDISNIITQLGKLGSLSTGENPLIIVLENALETCRGAEAGKAVEDVIGDVRTGIIIHALETGAGGTDKTEGYADLKSLLRNLFADKPEALVALEQYEKLPEVWKTPLKHSLAETGADRDKDILRASETLIRSEKSNVGIIGDHARVEGDIHQGDRIGIESAGDAVTAKDHGTAVKAHQIKSVTHVGKADNVTQHFHAAPEKEDKPDPEKMRNAYLYRLLCDAGILSLEGIDPESATCDTERLNLGAIYTALLTKSSEGREPEMMKTRETRRVSALEVANHHQHAVLLGDPGSGKTTFVNFAALCLAGESLGNPDANLELLTRPIPPDDEDDEDEAEQERQPWEHGPLLPVRVILRDFAARNLPDSGASASDLWQFITDELEKAELSEFGPYMKRELQEKGGLLMLDGLDEVPEADDRRVRIRAVVEDFMKTFRLCRVLVTSRTYAYQKQDWRIPGLYESVLAPFSNGQIRGFVHRWYAHFAELKRRNADDAQGRAELLKRAIFSSTRLRELAERPLLLTLMASLHSWRGGSLPEKREELYAATADLLLDWWERPKIVRDKESRPVVVQPSLIEWLKTDRDKMRGMLNTLAYNAHAGQPELTGVADIAESNLVQGLWELSDNPDVRHKELMRYLSNRAGVLLPRGVKIYSFPHRTFQEYLAACYLTDTDYPDLVSELCREEPNRWREVCLLAGAKAARGSSSTVWSLAEALCYREPDDPEADTPDVWGAHIAGQALSEIADMSKVSPRNRAKLERIRKWLLRIMEENLLPATERAIAGNNLAVLGDPRSDPDMFYLPKDEELGFVKIPAGEFLMGSDKEQDAGAWDDESPQHTVKLSEYHISRYPVTVAQFRVFMQDTGLETEGWDRRNTADNHPVVEVSWDDAVAYCEWLTEKLKDRDWQIRLPTEAEWEKAARGTDGRIYPWGDEADTDKMNYNDTGIGTTSAVGCFPKGESPYGVREMSGNVREWCRDWFGDYPSDTVVNPTGAETGSLRVFRGGYFGNTARYCRCALRNHYRPGLRDYDLGFRLVRAAP